jgi:hypothetical protein
MCVCAVGEVLWLGDGYVGLLGHVVRFRELLSWKIGQKRKEVIFKASSVIDETSKQASHNTKS